MKWHICCAAVGLPRKEDMHCSVGENVNFEGKRDIRGRCRRDAHCAWIGWQRCEPCDATEGGREAGRQREKVQSFGDASRIEGERESKVLGKLLRVKLREFS